LGPEAGSQPFGKTLRHCRSTKRLGAAELRRFTKTFRFVGQFRGLRQRYIFSEHTSSERAQPFNQPSSAHANRADEAHGEQDEIGSELELRSGDRLEREAPLGADALDANAMQRGDTALVRRVNFCAAIE
jgi:hypothetical protein